MDFNDSLLIDLNYIFLLLKPTKTWWFEATNMGRWVVFHLMIFYGGR